MAVRTHSVDAEDDMHLRKGREKVLVKTGI